MSTQGKTLDKPTSRTWLVPHMTLLEYCLIIELGLSNLTFFELLSQFIPVSEKPPAEGANKEGIHVEQQQPTEEQNEEGIEIGSV